MGVVCGSWKTVGTFSFCDCFPCTFGVAVFLVWKLEEFELTTACFRHILMMWSCDLLGKPSPQPSPSFWAYCPQMTSNEGRAWGAFLTMKHFLFDWLKGLHANGKSSDFFTGDFLPNFEKNNFPITRSS
jgi:hypothetical protein